MFLIVLLLAIWGAFDFSGDKVSTTGRHTAMVTLDGEISADTNANAEDINTALESAFDDAGTAGVILRCNSPGGSPVQAGIIYNEIRRLRAKYPSIPLYVVVGDMCASGGYYAAAAADKIYVDKASIVGSIGVLMDSFGFTGLMDKLGIQRRLHTSGENKGFFDPFSPETPKMDEHAQDMLDQIHAQFIDAVRQGRGKRLHETPDMFSASSGPVKRVSSWGSQMVWATRITSRATFSRRRISSITRSRRASRTAWRASSGPRWAAAPCTRWRLAGR